VKPPTDSKGRTTLDAPVKLDEEVEFDEAGRAYLSRLEDHVDEEKQRAASLTDKPEARRRILTMKALVRLSEGDRVSDIAEDFGVATGTLTGWIARFKQKLKTAEIDLRLDQIAVPLATDNLIHGLLAGDKDYTLETLKGRGKLRRYTNADETVHHDLPPLRIEFTQPSASAGYSPEQIAMGRVVGRAALPAPASPGQITDQRVLDAQFDVVAARKEHDDET
jgi:transposase-like protein